MKNNQIRSLYLFQLNPIISSKRINCKTLMLSQILRHKLLLSCLILLITVTASAQTVTVNTVLDENNGVTTSIANLIATPGGAGISLREAIIAANNTAGANTILFNAALNGIPITLTIAGANENNAATGDLDITDALTITGNGPANTIVQAGTTNANGIDKVFSINPSFTLAFATNITGITIRFGKNPSGFTGDGFGGGLDWEGSGTGTLVINNCVITDNKTTDGDGGGLTVTNTGGGTGSVTITNSTISNNTPARVGVNSPIGGAIFVGTLTKVSLTNCILTGNSVSGSGGQGQGGGIYLFGPSGATGQSSLTNCTISNNTSPSDGAGIYSIQPLTINNTIFSGNNSGRLGGALFVNHTNATTTISKSIFTGNNAATRGGGIYLGSTTTSNILNVSFSRFAGNTSPLQNGVAIDGGTATLQNNWWGCNLGPSNAACNQAAAFGTGSINFTPWLVLNQTASPASICIGATSTLTASFLLNSSGGAIAASNLDVLIGQPIIFNSPVNGTLSAAQTTIQASGTATATFTGTTGGNGSANAVFVPLVENFTATTNPTITVNGTNTAVAPSSNPTVCVNTAISPNITIATTGATGIGAATGLPAGVSAVWAANVITISGTPTTTVGSPFSYSIPLTGGCGTVNATGIITVNPVNMVTFSSAAGTNTQTVAINTPITNITYNTTGAIGATVTGLPPGVTGSWAANVVTISGSPSSAAGSPYTYTVNLTGGCGTVTTTGTITVTTCAVTLTSAAGTNAQTVCINTPITNITYATVGATGANFSGLPAGVTGNWVADVITISGTPTSTVGSPFNYTITQVGGSCAGTTATGTITVNPNNTITLTSAAGTNAQTVCINTPITNITYSTTGATGATFSGLPAGVSGAWAANVVTISGTPTTTAGSPFSYTITLTGGCGTVTTTGTIAVNPLNTITLTSGAGTNAQTVAINSAITNITYSTTGATGATFSGLPTGVTGNLAANVVTISGSPTTAVGSPFSYTVTLTGGCGTITATGSIAVNPCTSPTINCPSIIGSTNTLGTCGRVVNYTTTTGGTPPPTVTYAFTGATTASGSGNGSGSTFNVGVTNVTVTVTNSCGSTNCSFIVTIADNQPPTVTAGTIGSCYPTVAAAQAAALAATSATDNCPGTITKTASTVGTCSAVITVTATDANSNATAVTYNTRIDNTAPTVTVGTIGSCYPSVSAAETAALAATSATDNCPGTLTKVASTAGTCSAVVTVTTTDGCGNATAVTYNTRIDNTAPTVTVGTIGSCYPSVSAAETAALAATSATDNCSGALTKVASTVGTCSAVVTVTTTDGCGNATAVTYNTRIDNTAPTVTVGTIASCYPSVSAAETAALAATSATDNCPGALTKIASTVGTCSAVITVTTTDGCGNATAVTYNTRIDNTPPTITCPDPIIVCDPSNVPIPNPALVTASDNCPGLVTVTHSGDVNNCPSCINTQYTITRTYRATDACGNFTECTQLITVRIVSTAPTGISGTSTICNGSSTTLTLVGGSAGTAAVAEWFSGSCGGMPAGTGNSITVSPSINTTYFVRYKGICNTTACASQLVTVYTPSVGGTVTPANTQGCGPQTVNLTVSGINGVVTQWERQTNCNGAWASIGNAGLTSITVTTPNASTCYRAVVTNGVCPTANSTISTITVDKPAVGGRVTLQSNQNATSTALCPSQNALLIPVGFTGKVAIWQYTFGTSSIWYDLPGTEGQTTLTVNGSSISGTVFYRVVIVTDLGLCTGTASVAYSAAFRITKKANCLSPDGSSVVYNDIATAKGFTVVKAYPNPATDLVSLDIEYITASEDLSLRGAKQTEGVAQLEVLDVTGRQVLKQTVSLTEGFNTINLDISHLSRGIFIVKMTDSKNQKAMVKMVKE